MGQQILLKFFGKDKFKLQEKFEKHKERLKSAFEFDMALCIAYNQVIYTMCLIYAVISPVLSLLGALYFLFRLTVDKYNCTILYPKQHESSGNIA